MNAVLDRSKVMTAEEFRRGLGDAFDVVKCNSAELGLGDTTPVGIFLAGASPYGCLDMAGNVWEWTRSLWGEDWEKSTFQYPYNPKDGREQIDAPDHALRVLRGGAYWDYQRIARCAFRYRNVPLVRDVSFGFRVVVRPQL